ncbi:TPA: hypothetical protein MHZ68_16445 [Klebsiella pneumoniae subsp. pneumoniae]|nr:hypothetical protein [Klebsiella pneumoniae subsp. pneumoniae]
MSLKNVWLRIVKEVPIASMVESAVIVRCTIFDLNDLETLWLLNSLHHLQKTLLKRIKIMILMNA